MAACGYDFTVVVAEDGEVRAFGNGDEGQIGLGTAAEHLVPARVGGREVFDALVVMVATGDHHAAAVVADGSLYTWGLGQNGRLGHGDRRQQLRPMRLDKSLFGASPAVQVACGYAHDHVYQSIANTLQVDGLARITGRTQALHRRILNH